MKKNNKCNVIFEYYAYYKVKGGKDMTNFGNTCCNACQTNGGGSRGFGGYAFILVLFILLVICGSTFLAC